MELTRSFSADQFARALESWDWADIGGKQPLFTSPFGDVFFQAQDGFWFLDLLEGTLTRPWSDADALQAELNTAAGQDRYLMAAPILGAAIAVENIEVMDFEVIVHITGQLHRQVRDMPPGSRITGFTVAPPPPQA